jgi:hypothetical protein
MLHQENRSKQDFFTQKRNYQFDINRVMSKDKDISLQRPGVNRTYTDYIPSGNLSSFTNWFRHNQTSDVVVPKRHQTPSKYVSYASYESPIYQKYNYNTFDISTKRQAILKPILRPLSARLNARTKLDKKYVQKSNSYAILR